MRKMHFLKIPFGFDFKFNYSDMYEYNGGQKGRVGYKSSPENPQYLLIYASPEFLVFDNRVISGDQRYTDR